MKITIEIPILLVLQTVRGIMENFPEASAGNVLQCKKWDYKNDEFTFQDSETLKVYELKQTDLVFAFQFIFSDKWPKGCTLPPIPSEDNLENWLCQCDATDFDAFVQIACLGEVIYG